jgi:hypothetical protein
MAMKIFKSIGKFLKSMLSDETGQQSTKRTIAIIGTLFLCVTMLLNSYSSEEIKPAPELVSAIEFIVIACIGATSLDKFANRGSASATKDETNAPN